MTKNNLKITQSFIDTISGVPAVIDRGEVDSLFAGGWFIGGPNIIDETASRTFMRHLILDPNHSVTEVETWADRAGKSRSKALRTEIGAVGVGQCEVNDYYPDEQGNYRLPTQTEDTPVAGVVDKG